ncbi:MAG: hypothetical protein O3C40_36290 [Planctomycetota bacterium]|nr:hypothetical protein [Planctomycetota bacterium]
MLTVDEDQTAQWDDDSLLERATKSGRIMFIQGDDFLAIGHRWQQSGREFAGIVYAHQLRVTIGQAVRDLEVIAHVNSADEMKNRIEFLPLR